MRGLARGAHSSSAPWTHTPPRISGTSQSQSLPLPVSDPARPCPLPRTC